MYCNNVKKLETQQRFTISTFQCGSRIKGLICDPKIIINLWRGKKSEKNVNMNKNNNTSNEKYRNIEKYI